VSSLEESLREVDDPREQLSAMIWRHTCAAVTMRHHLPSPFRFDDAPPHVLDESYALSQQLEKRWVQVVAANMRAGYLDGGDPLVTARLILGMIMSVSRWYRPNGPFTPQQVVATAARLVGVDVPPSGATILPRD
jgi:hypothetical protein